MMQSSRIPMSQWWTCLILLLAASALSPASSDSLRIGYYEYTCPPAESIVRTAVTRALSQNPGVGAGLIRMHFHDCFVRGCDGSVLLDSAGGRAAEKDHPANNPSLRGFEVIDEAKALIEAQCPGTVSCADILTFAARDSARILGGIDYAASGGRRDGRVSLLDEVTLNLPPPSFNARQLEDNFAAKGLSADDMVTLSGAHSIGISHCSSFSSRLYSFNATHQQDPSMDASVADHLRRRCPPPGAAADPTTPLDVATPNRLDNRYYKNLKNRRGVLSSDQALLSSHSTAKMVRENAKRPGNWEAKFGGAMVRMGSIDVLTGAQGEIRKYCRVVN